MAIEPFAWRPDWAVAPGEILIEALEERAMSQSELARRMGRPTKTINEIVLDALRQYRPGGRGKAPRKEVEAWRRLLRADRKRGRARPEVPVEALYDDATGLPV